MTVNIIDEYGHFAGGRESLNSLGANVTRSELVSAYQSGRINRRTLIKGLTAVGMSLTVATSMADKLRAAPRAAGEIEDPVDDTYEPVGGEEEEPPVTQLPNTGIGGDEKSSLAAPIAVIGGAAALVASRIRRTKSSETN